MRYSETRILRSNACTKVGRPQKSIPSTLSFTEWVNRGFERIIENGGKVESTELDGTIYTQINRPGLKPVIVLEDELRADYEKLYLHKGVTA